MTSTGWRETAARGQYLAARAERATEDLLHEQLPHAVALGPCTIPGSRGADVDGIWVHGGRVLLVDAKLWEPGTYWGGWLGVTPRRGTEMFAPATHRHAQLAVDRMGSYVRQSGGVLVRPLWIVWPSKAGESASVRWLSVPGADVVSLDGLEGALTRRGFVTDAPDPATPIVAARLGLALERWLRRQPVDRTTRGPIAQMHPTG
ncbi:hypothetical protein [Oerskovia enterophila]|nr:hypothetical protein [Oerskovia enterophila]